MPSESWKTPFIPDSAPFPPSQRAWLNGFLAGWFQPAPVSFPPEAVTSPSIHLTILFGSQTGNAKSLAFKLSKTLKSPSLECQVADLASFPRENLVSLSHLLIVTSTYGEGDPPDNAKAFHQWLLSDAAPLCPNLKFGVFGLGDTNYEKFCQAAKDFDTRLADLGATRWLDLVTADVDYEADYSQWTDRIKSALNSSPSTPSVPDTASSLRPSAEPYGKSNPFPSTLLANRILNGAGSDKETRHFEFSLKESGLTYQVGDAIAVTPQNDSTLVASILAACQLPGDSSVKLSSGTEVSLEQALQTHYEIRLPSRAGLQKLSLYCSSSELSQILSPEQAPELSRLLSQHEWTELFLKYKPRFTAPTDLLQIFRKLSPRLYSISSSPKTFPDSVHATIRVVRYLQNQTLRKGVCSNFLALLDPASTVPVYIHSNDNFRLPTDPTTPLIMIGPGTGIAPFRAFLQDRAATGASGKNWLFFGDQHEKTDFLYRDELETFEKQGVLNRITTAFSRDQSQKIYVQHRLVEHSADLYRWIQDGAAVYVCGDATHMAKDVHQALNEILVSQGGYSPDKASQFLENMVAQKRYLRDVY